MSSTTPQPAQPRRGSIPKSHSNSGNRRPLSRPTTPLRPSSRSSLRESGKSSVGGNGDAPLEAFEPAFAELSDSMADLEINFMNLQLMHESLSRFNESFASFLYGLNMNAFCVDFPEAPIPDSFRRAREREENFGRSTSAERLQGDIDGETSFLTTDTSFVDNPPTSSKATPQLRTPAPASRHKGPSRDGAAVSARGGAVRGGLRGTRSSGLARAAKTRGAK